MCQVLKVRNGSNARYEMESVGVVYEDRVLDGPASGGLSVKLILVLGSLFPEAGPCRTRPSQFGVSSSSINRRGDK